MKTRTLTPRCCYCGKFLTYNSSVMVETTIDSEFTIEKIEYIHNECCIRNEYEPATEN